MCMAVGLRKLPGEWATSLGPERNPVKRAVRSCAATFERSSCLPMDLELKDKVAIVGGASKGLGRACAEVLAEEGAKVAVCSRSQADEVGRDGILVNSVCPGSIMSERMLSNVTARAKELGISLEDAIAQRAADTAVGRVGEPRELAYLVAFLASGKSSYITGTTI